MKQVLVVLLLLAGTALHANESPEALQEAFLTAFRANDADGIAALYSADATNFPVDSMAGTGPESVRQSWVGFFNSYQAQEISLSERHMEQRGDLAAAWGLFSITAMPAGETEAIVMQGRYMDVSQDFDGHWLYIADHASVPSMSE